MSKESRPFYKFKLIYEYIGIAFPSALSGDFVYEGSEGCAISLPIKPNPTSGYWIIINIVDTLRRELYSFFLAVFVADVLQSLYPDIRDANLVGHQVGADEHLVTPAVIVARRIATIHNMLEFIAFLWIKSGVLVALRHGHDIADFEGRELQQSIF